MAATADAVVVGGGVVGASTLFHLTRLGVHNAVLCERRQPGSGASGASGAFIQFHFCRNEPETHITQASMPVWERWDEIVGAGSCGWARAGYLRLEPAHREHILRERVELLRRFGVDSSVINPDEIARLAPYLHLNDITAAAYEPGSGYADSNATINGFLDAANHNGGEVRTDTTVTGVRVTSCRVTGVDTTSGPIDAPLVILAAGAWTLPLIEPLGVHLPVTSALTRAYGFEMSVIVRDMVTVGDGAEQSYFHSAAPDSAHVLVGIGAGGRRTLDDPNADEEPVPAEGIADAHARLAARLRGATGARSTGGRSGPITLTPDDLPIIDEHPAASGLFLFTGDGGASFKTAPAIGTSLAEWAVLGSPQTVDVSAFSIARFTSAANGGEHA